MVRAPFESPERFGLDPSFVRDPRDPSGDGPLSGLSFAAKEVFDLAGHVTRSGNPDWLRTHSPATADAPAVARLLEAGARLRGRTLSDELAFSLAGENLHYGTPLNPRAPGRVPGGSSSGSASAVAAGCVDFALGTDTSGSVRIPASYCGLYGLRPTHGAIDARGVTPLAPAFDTVGWFAVTAAVLERVGAVLLPPGEIRPLRRIVPMADAFDDAVPGVAAALRPALDRLASLGLAFDAPAQGLSLAAAAQAYRVLQSAEVWRTHGEWFERTRPSMAPEIAARLRAASQVTAREIEAARREADVLRARIDDLLAHDGVLCLPTAPDAAPLLGASAQPDAQTRMRVLAHTCIAGLCGLPQVSLPLGVVDGLPVGLGLIAGRGRDRDLLALAGRIASGDGNKTATAWSTFG
jgi:amidase